MARTYRCIVLWLSGLGVAVALLACSGPRLHGAQAEGSGAETLRNGTSSAPLLQRSSVRDGARPPAVMTETVARRSRWSVQAGDVVVAPPRAPASQKRDAAQNLLLLPVELETDNGAANGNANLLRLLPAYEWPRGPRWRIQHLDLITLANAPGGLTGAPGNPDPVAGPRATGLSDITHLSFFAPTQTANLIWGAGAALGIPTATDEVLGSGKWSAGPALRLTYRKKPWNLGVVAAQRWSFAGASDRGDIDQLMMRCTFRRQLGESWYLVSAPIITANWSAAAGERWLVPLGGGLGRKFDLGGRPWAASVQAYGNVLRPTGAPTWSIRLTFTAFIPLGH